MRSKRGFQIDEIDQVVIGATPNGSLSSPRGNGARRTIKSATPSFMSGIALTEHLLLGFVWTAVGLTIRSGRAH